MTKTPYVLLEDEPETQLRIAWIEDDGDGDTQTLTVADESYSVDGDPLPVGDGYIYEQKVTGLEAGTEYEFEIAGEITRKTSTLASSSDSIRILATGDHHPGRSGRSLHADDLLQMASESPDLILITGDIVNHSHRMNDENYDDLVMWFEWYADAFDDHMPPMFVVPGNHEYDHASGTGPGDIGESVEDPGDGFFQTLFPNNVDLDPEGHNYGEVTLGNKLQIVGIDNHAADFEDQHRWLEDNISEDVRLSIPMMHLAFLPYADRPGSDQDVQFAYLDRYGSLFYDNLSVKFHLVGNDHARSLSHPIAFSDSEPDGDEFYGLDSGKYAQVADNNDIRAIQEVKCSFMGQYDGGPPGDFEDWHLKSSVADDEDDAIHYVVMDIDFTEVDNFTSGLQNGTDGKELESFTADKYISEIEAGQIARVVAEVASENGGEIELQVNGDDWTNKDSVEIEDLGGLAKLDWFTDDDDAGLHSLRVESGAQKDTVGVSVID